MKRSGMKVALKRMVGRFIIFAIRKYFADGLSAVWSSGTEPARIIAWRWMWSSEFEAELKSNARLDRQEEAR